MLFFLTLLPLTFGCWKPDKIEICDAHGRRPARSGRRRFEESDVLRTFLQEHGYIDDIGRFLNARSMETVTGVCDEIMGHVSGTHKNSMMQYLFSSETEGEVMTGVGGETLNWVGEQVKHARRRFAQEQTWNVTRRMSSDTWSQSLGYVVAGNALIADSRMDAGAQGLFSSFGNPQEGRKGCARFVDLVNDEVQEAVPKGLQYHAEEEIVSIDESFAASLGIKELLPTVTLATGQIVLALFNSCRRFANQFGGPTCLA